MKEVIYNITAIFQILVYVIILYYFIISFFGLYKKNETISYTEPEHKFAIIVAAHNEELVIGQIIESLKCLDYPKELYDIFVVADNCCDNTANIAKSLEANVFIRTDIEKRGKGFALEWMFNRIFEMNKKYDAVVVFDADNLVSKNFLKEMDRKLKQGYKVVQGYLDSKNPYDSWISQAYSIAFWTSNRIFQLARSNLELSNQIGGTGFCIKIDILKEIGWQATCLTEDLEFTCRLVLNNLKVGWSHEAIIYDEKPLTLSQSWKQRKRWMQGYSDVASRFLIKLFKKALLEGDMAAFDCALYVMQPFVIVGLGVSAVLTFIQNNSANGLNIFVINSLLPSSVWYLISIFQFIFTPLIMMIEKKLTKKFFIFFCLYSLNILLFNNLFDSASELHVIIASHISFIILFSLILLKIEGKKSFKIFIWYLFYGLYTLTWVPIAVQGIIDRNKKEWCHTKHTRQISISEIEDLGGRSAA